VAAEPLGTHISFARLLLHRYDQAAAVAAAAAAVAAGPDRRGVYARHGLAVAR
jgi:hypothetical protein